jgi:hypothetical protein
MDDFALKTFHGASNKRYSTVVSTRLDRIGRLRAALGSFTEKQVARTIGGTDVIE